jgi:hypothetical protein
MQAINSEYNAVKSDLSEAERKLNNIIVYNNSIEKTNEIQKDIFESESKKVIHEYQTQIDKLSDDLLSTEKLLKDRNEMLLKFLEPTPEKLPESVEISDELKQGFEDYKILEMEIWKAKGVNENNIKLIAERAKQIKEKQSNLLQIGENIVTLSNEITDYFSNLSKIVKTEFAGDILLDVELLEFVMSRDEYKDCFKITANGKVFPYECNGALQNNVKLQILANMQRLKDYKGVTVMDNCEANTTQKINTLGLNCVLSFATLENELLIK